MSAENSIYREGAAGEAAMPHMSQGSCRRPDSLFIEPQENGDGVRIRPRNSLRPHVSDFVVFLTKLMAIVAGGVYFLYAVITSEVWRANFAENIPIEERIIDQCLGESECNLTIF